jgi:predicted lipoprotein
MRFTLFAFLALTSPAIAGINAVVDTHALPNVARFAEATAALDETAQADCRAEAVRPAFQSAFDAWMGVSHLRLGPLEENGRALSIAFWPDGRGMTQRTVNRLLQDEDTAVTDAESFAEVSIAGRGFYALERLLYDEAQSQYDADSYACELVQAQARDLARSGADLKDAWQEFAPVLKSAGDAGNTRYLSEKEAIQAVFTALTTGLTFDADTRMGRPLGTFDKPRPKRAEARRSGRSLRNVILSLTAMREMTAALGGDALPLSDASFAETLRVAQELDDPVFASVSDVMGRFKVEVLQLQITATKEVVVEEIGAALEVTSGFNLLDGD